MTRSDFECLTTKQKRAYAEKQYHVVSRMIFQELQERGIYNDPFGRLTEIHHIWPRSHCPLWYVFQRENLTAVSHELHHTLHCKAPSEMTTAEREYYEEFEAMKLEMQIENKRYNGKNYIKNPD